MRWRRRTGRRSLDERRRWYRYHHLFAELLRFRLEHRLPGEVEGLRERASRCFEERGEVVEALELAAAMEAPGRLVALLDRHGYRILGRSEFGAFARWLRRVPEPLEQPWPMFLVAAAWFRVQTERSADVDALLQRVAAAVESPPEEYPADRLLQARLHLAALRAFVLRVAGRGRESLAAAEEALRDLPPDEPSIRAVLELNQGAVHARLGEMEEAREHLQRAHDAALRGAMPYLVLASLGHLGAVALQTEGVPAALHHLDEAAAAARIRGLDHLPAFAIILYQSANARLVADDLAGARSDLERALDESRGERETDILVNVLIHLARLERVEGRPERARELLTEAAALASDQGLQPFGTSLEVEWAMLEEAASGRLRRPEAAPPGLERGAERGAGWTAPVEAEVILQAQHCLKLGRWEEAAERAEELLRESVPRHRGVARCVALVTLACTATDAAERHRLLVDGLERAAARGYVRPLLDGGAPVRDLLESALGGPLPRAVRDFVKQRLLPRFPGGEPEAPAPPAAAELELTERELEVLAHLARGLTNRDLARELYLSENTVKTHLKRVFSKLDVSTRTGAVERARRHGLLPPDPL